ncbi:MAG: DUF2249 domain-containing protein [Thiomonas sp.]
MELGRQFGTRPVRPITTTTGIAKRFRHATIFGALDALDPGETMEFFNDHDPLPLLAQIQQRYGERLHIAYQSRSPDGVLINFSIVKS